MPPQDSGRPGGNLNSATASLWQVHFIMLLLLLLSRVQVCVTPQTGSLTPLKHTPPHHPAGAHVLILWEKKQNGKCLVLMQNLWEMYMLILLHPDSVNDANLKFSKNKSLSFQMDNKKISGVGMA